MIRCNCCSKLLYPPIYECKKKHILCPTCRPNKTVCEICHGTSIVRNFKLEKYVMKTQLFNCKNYDGGCRSIFNYSNMKVHEEDCIYQSYKCFMGSCEWEGTLFSFQDHFRDRHESNYYDMDEEMDEAKANCIKRLTEEPISDGRISMTTLALNFHGSKFLLMISRFKKEQQLFHSAYIVRIGPKKSVEEFLYGLEFYNADGKLVVFESTPQSILNVRFDRPWDNGLVLGDIFLFHTLTMASRDKHFSILAADRNVDTFEERLI